MATPLHHDQPQQSLRVLQTLKSNAKKNADNPLNSQSISRKSAFSQATMPPQHAENLSNQRDSQYRRSAQQNLPPRPPLSSSQLHHRQQQQYLRQRRTELGSTNRPHDVSFLEDSRINTSDRIYAVSSLEEGGLSSPDRPPIISFLDEAILSSSHAGNSPHVESPPEGRIHHVKVKEQSSPQQHRDFLTVISTGERNLYHVKVKEPSSSHPQEDQQLRHRLESHGPYAGNPFEGHLQNTKENEKRRPTQSLAKSVARNSRPLDYKAAIVTENLPSHVKEQHQHIHHEQPHLEHSLEQFFEQPHELEDYFECTQDGKQQNQGMSPRIDHPHQAEEQQQHILGSPGMQGHCAEEGPDRSCGDGSHALSPINGHLHQSKVAEQHQQKQSHNPLAMALMEHHDHEDRAADQVADVCEASDQSLQQLPHYQPELSLASPEDSYFYISKEAVEQDYRNECHLSASPTNREHHAKGQQRQSYGHVYDYSQAGVTLVEDSSEEPQQSDLSEKQGSNGEVSLEHSSDNKLCKEGLSEHQHRHQDFESPPLFLGFNQNSTRFACGTSKGFRVYDINTMKECFSSMVGGVGLVELLLCTNTFLLVGGGPNPSFPPNKVILWDGLKGAYCGDRSQKFPILAVKVRQDRLVVVVENEVIIYNYGNAKLLFQVNTISNTKGLCAISIKEGPSILACPGLKKGEVRIEHIGTNRGREELPTRNSIVISAHDSSLACMALTLDGSLLATASDKGTLIRIFSTHYGTPLQEVRRGVDRAEIYSIAFSPPSDWLAVSSDKGTVHIFGLKTMGSKSTETDDASTTSVRNPGSTLSFIKGVLPKYFSSQWSFAQFKLREEMKSVVAFGQEKHSVLILGTDGSFYKCFFDPEHGGDMQQLEYLNFMKTWEATV